MEDIQTRAGRLDLRSSTVMDGGHDSSCCSITRQCPPVVVWHSAPSRQCGPARRTRCGKVPQEMSSDSEKREVLEYFLHDTGKPSRGRWNYCLLVSQWPTNDSLLCCTFEDSVERFWYFQIHPSPFVQYPHWILVQSTSVVTAKAPTDAPSTPPL